MYFSGRSLRLHAAEIFLLTGLHLELSRMNKSHEYKAGRVDVERARSRKLRRPMNSKLVPAFTFLIRNSLVKLSG